MFAVLVSVLAHRECKFTSHLAPPAHCLTPPLPCCRIQSIPAADVDLWKGALLKRNADKKAAAARRAIDCSGDSPPAKRAKAAAPGATATRPGTAAELMGGWSQEDLLGASQG